jgi:hypothetical protein
MTGIDFPTAGCWEMTGRYNDEELTFVVWVSPLAAHGAIVAADFKAP